MIKSERMARKMNVAGSAGRLSGVHSVSGERMGDYVWERMHAM